MGEIIFKKTIANNIIISGLYFIDGGYLLIELSTK